MLFLDHFYISLAADKFHSLKEFFNNFSSSASYKVNSNSGSWEGIYPFQKQGAFPEFLLASDRNPLSQIGIAYSDVENNFLEKDVLKNYPKIEWLTEIQTKEDGSEYYCSIHPKQQPEHSLYLWILDWHGEMKEKRRNYGKSEENPFDYLTDLTLRLNQESFQHLEKQISWLAVDSKLETSRSEFSVMQYHGQKLKIKLEEAASKEQSLKMTLKCNRDISTLVTQKNWSCQIEYSTEHLIIDTKD